ncbi:MAG: type II toxin-antitoxin system HicB family antitoxin [Oscillospiraceae bacterium]
MLPGCIDLPGCISSGSSFEEARKEAEEALDLHLCGMEKDGEYILTPSASIENEPGDGHRLSGKVL